MTTTRTAPAIGAWDDATHGFWTGGRHVTACELTPGDVYRWHTISGYVVAAVESAPAWGPYPECVRIVHDDGAASLHTPGELLELIPADNAAATYVEHVSHDMLTYPTPEDPGASAWEQLGPGMTDHTGTEFYGVRGMDGARYVAEGVSPGAWRIVRAGHYGLGAVVHSHTLKGAVQRLNAFHQGETCVHCSHVNSTRGHGCGKCGRTRYA